MHPKKLVVFASLFVTASLSACNCGGNPPGKEDSGVTPEQDSGSNPNGDGGNGDGGNPNSDAGQVVFPTDPTDPTNVAKDSDCDGLTDQEEFANIFAGGKKTDPGRADTDGDGIKDGVELGRTSSVNTGCNFVGDAEPASRTVPTEADSDADGLHDGQEDSNRNGKVDTGETDPANPDSDGDGIADGVEDANKNTVVDTGETDPRNKDTDFDLIGDNQEKTVTLTDPLNDDTDGDGCRDGFEDLNQNGTLEQGETNPKLAGDCGTMNLTDTDSDGIPDIAEDVDRDGVWDANETNFQSKDTDGDGIEDGVEDKNKNGALEPGETNPRRVDSDCDGLIDGPTRVLADGGTQLGEDQNANGVVNAGETDPTKRDTDGDGVRDGVELGVSNNPDPTFCVDFIADAEPATNTDPTAADSDGDGIPDGAEDSNQNGRVDNGELNPRNSLDVLTADGGSTPAAKVCTVDTLRPVIFKEEGQPDLQVALPTTFNEVKTITLGGEAKGIMGYDDTRKVAFLLFRKAAGTSTDPTTDEGAVRAQLNAVGAITNPLPQTFTTWDGYAAVQAFYDQAGTNEMKTRANELANALVGAGAGVLTTQVAPTTGPFKLQVEYVHRANAADGGVAGSVVVLIALTPATNFVEPAIFTVNDTAGGSALAQFGDATGIQCETFAPTNGNIDFLFVVDDSCSMANKQLALANSAQAMATSLSNSTLNWRVGLVTTNYHFGTAANSNLLRGFTRNVNLFQAWLTQNSVCGRPTDGGLPICSLVPTAGNAPFCGVAQTDGGMYFTDGGFNRMPGANGGCWIDTQFGSGNEGILGAARKATDFITPASATEVADKLRPGAQLVLVLLGDADDQTNGYSSTTAACGGSDSNGGATCTPAADFVRYFTAADGGTQDAGTMNKLGAPIPVHGIICPALPDGGTANCGDFYGARPQRHAAVITATGGVRGDICPATGCGATPPASIPVAMAAIVNSSIGQAGHKTEKPPIGASIKVAMDAVENSLSCNPDDLPRSRANGFDFDGVNRTLSFFGACRPSAQTTAAAVSYRYWIDVTTNPNGSPPPCSTDPYFDPNQADFCRGNLVCNRVTNVCECPEGCGGGTAPPGKVCNPNRNVCDFVCTDCNGTCTGYQTCDTASCGCQCVQNATCAPGFKFQNGGGICGCVCDTAALNCGSEHTADANTCSCVCKPDCGGCGPGTTCNFNACACVGVIGLKAPEAPGEDG